MAAGRRNLRIGIFLSFLFNLEGQTLSLTLNNIVNNVNPSCDIRVSYKKLESSNFNTPQNPVSLFNFHLFFAKHIKTTTLEKFAKRRANIQRMQNIDCRFNIIDTHHCLTCDIPGLMNLWLITIFREPRPFDMEGVYASFEAIPFNSYTLLVYHRSLEFLKSKGPNFSILPHRQSNFDKILALVVPLRDSFANDKFFLCIFPISMQPFVSSMTCVPYNNDQLEIRFVEHLLENAPPTKLMFSLQLVAARSFLRGTKYDKEIFENFHKRARKAGNNANMNLFVFWFICQFYRVKWTQRCYFTGRSEHSWVFLKPTWNSISFIYFVVWGHARIYLLRKTISFVSNVRNAFWQIYLVCYHSYNNRFGIDSYCVFILDSILFLLYCFEFFNWLIARWFLSSP